MAGNDDAIPAPDGSTGATLLHTQLRLARRELAAERRRSRAAETERDKARAEMRKSIDELGAVQEVILERSEQQRLVMSLGRGLSRALDGERVADRAAAAVGAALGLDRVQVVFAQAPAGSPADADSPHDADGGRWVRAGSGLPLPPSYAEMPNLLRRVLERSAGTGRRVAIDDLHAGLGDLGRRPSWLSSLRTRALVATPLVARDQLVGWLVAERVDPGPWPVGHLDVLDQHAQDLAAALVLARTFQHQQELVHQLQELDRTKNAFVSTVSHELRTPLTSISGYTEMALEGGFGECPPRLERALSTISRNAGRLQSLVEDLLTLSVYDAAGLVCHRTDVPVADLLDECGRSVDGLVGSRDVDLAVEAAGDAGSVFADRKHADRILTNLLGNAVKFTPDGGRVRVAARRADAWDGSGRRGAVIEVSDTGPGIPPEEQEKVFERFFRGSSAVRDEIQGTGLGLPLVRALVEDHQGLIELRSEVGHGTVVRVWLPAVGRSDETVERDGEGLAGDRQQAQDVVRALADHPLVAGQGDRLQLAA